MEGNNVNGDMPTEKQLATIRRLAGQTKSYVDIKQIATKKQASDIIEGLLAKKGGNNGNGNGSNGSHSSNNNGNKIAYGLAVKLVSSRYQQQNMDTKADSFWKDVDEFYQQYLEHQDRAIKLGSMG